MPWPLSQSLFLWLYLCAIGIPSCAAVAEDGTRIEGGPEKVVQLVLERHAPDARCRFLEMKQSQVHRSRGLEGGREVVIRVQRARADNAEREVVRIWATDEAAAWAAAEEECSGFAGGELQRTEGQEGQQILGPTQPRSGLPTPPELEIRPLQTSGPSSNRVDLFFLSDGYTEEDKGKFFADAAALVREVGSGEGAFGSVSPLINWWGGFVASKESGVGTGGKPKDTPFGLFRPGTELRGVYYAHPEVARAACHSLGTQCDYPILLGNSPLYGGLGGEFTTITASALNGPLVLRHELGHSIIDVGEEYDGGGYFGVNAEPSLTHLGWSHWLTEPEHVRAERNALPLLDYAWTMLNSSVPWQTRFNTTGTFPRNLLRFSLSGIPRAADLKISLDGRPLPWSVKPGIGVDRWFYDIPAIGGLNGLEAGEHMLEFALVNNGREGEAQLCNVEVFEYGDEREFNTGNGFIGAFPTYSDEPPYDFTHTHVDGFKPKEWNVTSYRPTNEGCLMRQVTTPTFCPVCKEELWMRLLAHVDLFDNVTVSCSARLTRTIKLALVPLEGLDLRWEKDGAYVPELEGLREVDLWDWDSWGSWNVTVQLRTPEIRRDVHGLSRSSRQIEITSPCPS